MAFFFLRQPLQLLKSSTDRILSLHTTTIRFSFFSSYSSNDHDNHLPGLSLAADGAEIRSKIAKAAVELGKFANYTSAGTVEFIYDDKTGKFYFLEVNTRLQVEHGVTEMVLSCGSSRPGVTVELDLVEWMLLQAQGKLPALRQEDWDTPVGHAIQVRVYSEDVLHDYRGCCGLVQEMALAVGDEGRVG